MTLPKCRLCGVGCPDKNIRDKHQAECSEILNALRGKWCVISKRFSDNTYYDEVNKRLPHEGYFSRVGFFDYNAKFTRYERHLVLGFLYPGTELDRLGNLQYYHNSIIAEGMTAMDENKYTFKSYRADKDENPGYVIQIIPPHKDRDWWEYCHKDYWGDYKAYPEGTIGSYLAMIKFNRLVASGKPPCSDDYQIGD